MTIAIVLTILVVVGLALLARREAAVDPQNELKSKANKRKSGETHTPWKAE